MSFEPLGLLPQRDLIDRSGFFFRRNQQRIKKGVSQKVLQFLPKLN